MMAARRPLPIQDYEQLSKEVDANSDVVTISMQALRTIHGAERLGSLVVTAISAELAKRGLGHQPIFLPNRHLEEVRIFRKGSRVAELIEAAMTRSKDADGVLRSLATTEADKKLQTIRELVC